MGRAMLRTLRASKQLPLLVAQASGLAKFLPNSIDSKV